MLAYFGVSSIGISRVRFSRLASTWGPHLGTLGAEIPKYNNFSTLYLFGISQVGISGLASTRELALGYSDAEIPKYRDLAIRCHFGISHVGFRDLRVQGNSHLGTPGAEIPKCRSLRGPFSLVQGFKTYAIKSSSRSLDKLSKKGVPVGRSIQGIT
jgi:hypothetical protein